MRHGTCLELADCSTFRQTLLARPPRLVHATALLLVALLGTAGTWSALTSADLVVRARGRVRPLHSPQKVANSARAVSASTGGRVEQVYVHEGDVVAAGDLLIRLETRHLDNDIAKERQTIQAAERELRDLADLERLTGELHEAALAKTAAELAQAREQLTQAEKRRELDIHLAKLKWSVALEEHNRQIRLSQDNATSAADMLQSRARLAEAKDNLARAELPVSVQQVRIAERSLYQVKSDFQVKLQELALRKRLKQGDLAAARIQLANRELERQHAEMRAPIAGVITRGDIKVGELLEPGKPALEIAQQSGFVFEAAVASEDVGQLRVGLPVRIKLDAIDFQRFGSAAGTVSFISPDSSPAEGLPQPIYTVKIALESEYVGLGEARARIKLGMAGQADIVTESESLLELLLKRIRQTISLG